MDINEIFSKSDKDVITALKNKQTFLPPWYVLNKEYDSRLHEVCDKAKRPDKVHKGRSVEEVSRIHLSLEKLIVTRMVEFMFATPVKRIYNGIDNDPVKEEISKAIESVYMKSRINTTNIERARQLFASCEVATLWFTADEDNTYYGFQSPKKLKQMTYSPMNGYSLYPIFDEMGDLIAFSVEYVSNTANKKSDTYMVTYTADRKLVFKNGVREEDSKNILGKIPFIYSHRRTPIWGGVQHIVKEIEFTLSRNSDVVAYNSAPILQVSGELQGREERDKSQRIMRVENGGSVSYVSWEQSIEAIKYQIDMLLRMMWMQVQLPDLSFENIKGLGAVSGEARKTLLTDAHLKVGDEQGAFLEYFDRETNIIKQYLSTLRPEWRTAIKEIEVEHVITPFIQQDEMNEIEKWVKASGGKPLVSQFEAIQLLGVSSDPKKTFDEIKQEEQPEETFDIFKGAM